MHSLCTTLHILPTILPRLSAAASVCPPPPPAHVGQKGFGNSIVFWQEYSSYPGFSLFFASSGAKGRASPEPHQQSCVVASSSSSAFGNDDTPHTHGGLLVEQNFFSSSSFFSTQYKVQIGMVLPRCDALMSLMVGIYGIKNILLLSSIYSIHPTERQTSSFVDRSL